MTMVTDFLILLGAAVLVVPLFIRIGLGAVLGYVAAGIIIGPQVLGLIEEQEVIRNLGELGILFLFFVIGLEIQPARLWALRSSIFSAGGLQMTITTALLYLISIGVGLPQGSAIIVASALALSSTAVALEMLSEKQLLTTRYGRSAMSIILFQILSIVPIVAMVQFFSPIVGGWPSARSIAAEVVIAVIALAALVFAGRYLLRPFFRVLASTRNSGLLTGGALFVLLGAALLMDNVKLPVELGAFLAGVLLADSEYRHELLFKIEPFKGLSLGLFFIYMGISIDWSLVLEKPLLVAGLAVGLFVVKFIVLVILATAFKHPLESTVKLGLTLSQGGEFAFVVFGLAVSVGVIPSSLSALLLVVVALSMAATPLLFGAFGFVRRHAGAGESEADETGARKLRIFISYSRRNANQALKLVTVLEREGFAVTIDTRDLPFGEEWQEELDYFIRESDIVVWLVSPESISSTWCKWELTRVLEYGKRLVPVAIAEVPPDTLPDELGKVQILPQNGVFDVSDSQQVEALTDALRTNRAWLKEHTRLSGRAHLWQQANRSPDWLLRGAELVAAEQWRDATPEKTPRPGPAVLDLIHASRIAETTNQPVPASTSS